MPDAITGKALVRIAGILLPVHGKGAERDSQTFRPDGKERTQKAALVVTGAHAAESGPADAAQQAEEHVFLGVPGMMAQHNPVGAATAAFFLQGGVPQAARRLFQSFAVPALFRDIDDGHAAGDAQRAADADGMRGIVGRFRAQSVIDAQRAQPPVPCGSEAGKQHGQRQRVRAAGNGQQQPRPRAQPERGAGLRHGAQQAGRNAVVVGWLFSVHAAMKRGRRSSRNAPPSIERLQFETPGVANH